MNNTYINILLAAK